MAHKGTGIQVDVKDGNIEKALKKFKKKIKSSNLMLEIFDRESYTKPSAKKREKKRKAIIRNKYKVEEFKKAENSHGQ